MSRNNKLSYNALREINDLLNRDNECGYCGSPCDEQHDFCSARCERMAQGGFQRKTRKQEWDG